MSVQDLRVTTAHLAELASRQGRAAAETVAATFAVEGVGAAVASTHGAIAAKTTSALEAVLATRRSAGEKMADISHDLCDKLADAARRYDAIDDTLGGALDGQMRTG